MSFSSAKGMLKIFIALSLSVFILFGSFALAQQSGRILQSTKTASELNEQKETTVQLAFPGVRDVLPTDIVFVLDKSGASAAKDIYNQAKNFLENVKGQAQAKGLNIKVGVVLFNMVGNIKCPLTDLVTGYDDILKGMNSSVSMGTNMHAGLLAAKDMLDNDTSVLPENKHVVLISDGATYLYCNNGDYTKAFTRSFGDPKKQTNPKTGKPYANGTDRQGGIWEYQSREYNLANDWKKFDDGTNFIFSQAMTSPKKLGAYLDYYRGQDGPEWSKYEYRYTVRSAYLGKGRKTTPIDINAPANIDVAFWKTDDTFQAMAKAKYNMYVYFKNAADFDGTVFLKYMARNTNGGNLHTDFTELEKKVVDRIAKGSYIEDVIGASFDFIDDPNKISLTVGSETLPASKAGNGTYLFGKDANGNPRFKLGHKNNPERLIISINETIFPASPVTLTYQAKLTNPPKEPGNHNLKVNEEAILYPKDSDGNSGTPIVFPVPTVKLKVDKPIQAPQTGDNSMLYLWIASATISAGILVLLLKKRRITR